jgi:hypothetical protein
MVGHHELVKPLSDLLEMVSCKDILVVISPVPYIRQIGWGRAVELFEVIKADFTPFWFELRPVRIQRGETPLAKRAPFSCRQSLLRVQSRGIYYRYEQSRG